MAAEHYRKVHTKLWADAKFASLSDAGKLVWMLLLSAPSMSPIPGVITASEHELAHMLGWSVEGYRKGYQEVLAKGFEVASEGRLVWVKKAIQYQAPESINNAKFWRHGWAEIPECQLKRYIWIAIKSTCLEWWEALSQGFPEPLPEGLPKGYAKPFETHSDSDSDSDTEEDQTRAVAPPKSCPCPEGWQPDDALSTRAAVSRASARGVDIAAEIAAMRDWSLGAGSKGKKADWNATFRNWLKNARAVPQWQARNEEIRNIERL